MALHDRRKNPKTCSQPGCLEISEFVCDFCGAALCSDHCGPVIPDGYSRAAEGDACITPDGQWCAAAREAVGTIEGGTP
jgi:hypothetical protein